MFTGDNFLVLLVIFGLCYWTPGYSISRYWVTSGIAVAMIVFCCWLYFSFYGFFFFGCLVRSNSDGSLLTTRKAAFQK